MMIGIELLPTSLPLGEVGRVLQSSPAKEGTVTMSENLDLIERLDNMRSFIGEVNSTYNGVDWHATLKEAKTELERLRKYEDTIKMACRW
jgi:hypothetical protein